MNSECENGGDHAGKIFLIKLSMKDIENAYLNNLCSTHYSKFHCLFSKLEGTHICASVPEHKEYLEPCGTGLRPREPSHHQLPLGGSLDQVWGQVREKLSGGCALPIKSLAQREESNRWYAHFWHKAQHFISENERILKAFMAAAGPGVRISMDTKPPDELGPPLARDKTLAELLLSRGARHWRSVWKGTPNGRCVLVFHVTTDRQA